MIDVLGRLRPSGAFGLGLPIHLYHAHLGVLLGHRFLLLVHTGRKTGLHRETVLEVVRYDPITRESVVAAGWGRRTGWLHNVEAGLAHEVWIGRDRFAPVFRILPSDEAERLFAAYERRNRLIAPIIRAVLSRLLGWRYDGTPATRRRAVEQLSLVGFRHGQRADVAPPFGGGPRRITLGTRPEPATFARVVAPDGDGPS